MTSSEATIQQRHAEAPAAWSAVLSIAVCVACLITVEFLPAGLLTPIADGLGISQGMAGQTLTATAFAAIFASLFVSTLTRGIDRRVVVLGYSVLLILSCLLTAFSTSFAMMLVGRVLLGLALGGFWAMAASVTMQLVATRDVPRALSVVFGGVSVALVLAAPAGSFLGEIVGWRGVFLLTAGFGVLCLIWEALVLPKLPSNQRRPVGAAFLVLNRTGVPAAMLAIFAIFAGQFAFFTYLRPFFESVSQFDVTRISAVLLLFGIANDAESAGGLQVAVIQIANAFGAALGGYLLDASGPKAPFLASTLLLALAGLVVLGAVSVRMGRPKAVFGCAGSLGANEASS